MLIKFLITYSFIIFLVYFEEVIIDIRTNPIPYCIISFVFLIAIYFGIEQKKEIDTIEARLNQISDSLDDSLKLIKQSNQEFYNEFENYK